MRLAKVGVVAFKYDADLQTLVHDPLLKLDKFDVQTREFLLLFLALELAVTFGIAVFLIGHSGSLLRLG